MPVLQDSADYLYPGRTGRARLYVTGLTLICFSCRRRMREHCLLWASRMTADRGWQRSHRVHGMQMRHLLLAHSRHGLKFQSRICSLKAVVPPAVGHCKRVVGATPEMHQTTWMAQSLI